MVFEFGRLANQDIMQERPAIHISRTTKGEVPMLVRNRRWIVGVIAWLMAGALFGQGGQDIKSPINKSQVYRFMEDNDLNTEDSGFMANVSEEQFRGIIKAAKALYDPMAARKNETLVINANWDDSTVNANCSRSGGTVTVNMYGGLARRPEVTPEGFALVLCHEIGHAYGGEPYIRVWDEIAAEGQADYYGAQTCLNKVLASIDYDKGSLDATDYIQSRCRKMSSYDTCVRQLESGMSLGRLLSAMKKSSIPDYETPDPTVVPRTLTSYPKTIQCRLDTYHNGALNLPRPACWYKS